MFRRRCLYLSLVCLALLAVFHGQLLPLLAYPLTRSDQLVEADFFLLARRTRNSLPAFSFAADFVGADTTRRILVMRDLSRRAESIGAEPNFVETTIEMLEDCGVPRNRIEVIGDGNSLTSVELLEESSRWLSERPPTTQMLVATHTFDCGYLMRSAKLVDPNVRPNMHIIGFDKHRVNAQNWWKNAVGLKIFLSEHLRLLHFGVFGNNRPDIDWDLDAYEQGLSERRHNLAEQYPIESRPIDSSDADSIPSDSQLLPQEQG